MASNLATIRVELIANAQKFKTNLDRGKKSLQGFEKATKKTTKGSKGLQEGLRNISGSIAAVQGPLGPVAGRLNAVGAIMGRVGVGTLALTGIFVLAGVAITKFAKAGAQAESQTLKLEALIKATGGAAQQTGTDIEEMAMKIGRGTLASVQGTRDAAGVLLTFKSISGQTFKDVLALSQDLAAVGFGSIKTAALQLGKALEEPEIGLSALRRVGVSFTEQQKEQIKVMSLTGKQAEAQQMILKALKEQVGGAGEGAAGGLSGAFDTLGENITLFFEKSTLGKGIVSSLTIIINGLANAMAKFIPEQITVSDNIDTLNRKYEENERKIANNIKEINRLGIAQDKEGKQRKRGGAGIDSQILKLEKEIEVMSEVNAVRKQKIDMIETEAQIINKTNILAEETVSKLKRQSESELELAESYGINTDFLKLKNSLEKKLRSSLGESEVATKAITIAIENQTEALMLQAIKQREAMLMIKNQKGKDDSDDKRLRSQKEEIENLKANAKERKVLNAIRAEENRLRALLKDLDPIKREERVNELIKERIPLLTEQTEKFFELTEELKKINTIADGVGDAFNTAGNKIVDAFLRGKMASLDFKDILRELIIQIQKTIIQTLILDQVNTFVKGATEKIFGLAGGGTVQEGQPTLVGERGPELFVPNSAGAIRTNADTKKTMSGGGGVNVTQNLNFAVGITNTVRAEVMNMLPAIQQSTVQAVADAKQRGGKFSKAFGS